MSPASAAPGGSRPGREEREDTNNLVAARVYELCFLGEDRPGRVGLGWGSMLGRMADYAESLPDFGGGAKGRLFPLIGGIGASYRGYHTNELARIVSGKAGYEAEYLYLPAFFDSEAELNFARSWRHIAPSRQTGAPWNSRSSTSPTSPPIQTSA